MSTMAISKDDYGSLEPLQQIKEDSNGNGNGEEVTGRGGRQGLMATWLRQDFISSRFNTLSLSSRRLGGKQATSTLIFGPTDRSVEALVSKEQIDGGGIHQHYHSVDRGLQDSAVWHRRKVALLNRRRDNTRSSIRDTLLKPFSQESQDSTSSVTSEYEYKFDHVAVDRLHSERWLFDQFLVAAIGVAMAFVGLTVSKTADHILEMKLDWAIERMDQYGFMSGFLSHVGISSLLAVGAFLPVAYRPVSAGSGIAEAKAILNGVVIPQCTALVTALCKALSVISSVSASLPAGLEGPMIHLGLCLGANANRLVPHRYQVLDPLRTDRFRIDYTAIGTAAGVAAAFRAPISGILFAMEEGASFWSTELTWRCFLATCVTVISMYAIISSSGSFQVTSMDLFNGIDSGVTQQVIPAGFVPSFELWEYVVFLFVGSAGGLIGAGFCVTNRSIAVLRRRLAFTTSQKGIEVLMIATVYASLAWILPSLPALTTCNSIAERTMGESYFRQFNCEEGEYSELATLLLNPLGGKGITLLFQEADMDAFSIKSCVAAGTVQLVTLCIAFGMSVSAGIFIPLLFIGACYGRAFAVAASLDPRTYAITGAAACLGGVVRVLISLTTIVASTTSLSFFLTPVMVATLFAQFVGNWASGRPGIYDIILGLRNVPFLEESCPEAPTHANIRARNVMKQNVTSIGMEMKVSDLLQVLRKSTFSDFPVVDESGVLVGLICRVDLLALLSRPEVFVSQGEDDDDSERTLSYADFDRARPQDPLPTGEDIGKGIKPEDLNKMIHVSPYLQIAPHTILGHGSAQRAYEMFRCLGLRSLIVIDKNHRPIGIITRRQLHLLEEIGMEEDEIEMKRKEASIYNDLSKRFDGQFE